MDSISLVIEPKEDNNLFIGHDLQPYLMAGMGDYATHGTTEITRVVQDGEVKLSDDVKKLNSHQQDAVKKSLTQIASLVHGPPGTGMLNGV